MLGRLCLAVLFLHLFVTFLKSERLTMHVIAPKEPVPIRFDAFGFGDAPCRLLRVNGVHGRPSVYRGTCFDVRHKLEDAGWESIGCVRAYLHECLKDGTTVPFWLTAFFLLPSRAFTLSFSPTYQGETKMSSGEGKRRFEAYARENSIAGVEPDESPPRHVRFKKPAKIPNPEDIAMGKERPQGSIHPPEGLGEVPRTGQSFAQARGFSGPPQRDFPFKDPPVGAGGRPRTPSFVRERESGYGSRRSIPEQLDDSEKVSDQSSNTEEVEARDERRERKRDFHPSLISMQQGQSAVFRKSAQPPDEQSLPGGEDSFRDEKGTHASFEKRALAPVYPVISNEVREFKDPVPRGGATAAAAKDAEEKALGDFDARAVAIYVELDEMGVEMEITNILIDVPQDDWVAGFAALARPKRAATGLRYVRLFENFLEWAGKMWPDKKSLGKAILDKETVWKYLFSVVQEGRGKKTPASLLHAVQFFGNAFGYHSDSFRCMRCRKLADTHAKEDKPRSQAPMFNVKTMEFLEQTITNPRLSKGLRVTAGKLRLCIQASLRWDDLQRTPFGNVEWVRRRGENRVVGLRSKFGDSKTGPRPWIASYLGVSEDGDDWLPVFVNLLMEVHGEGWCHHDHMGKSFTPDGSLTTTAVASFDQDVQFLRWMLSAAVEEKVDLGLSLSQAKSSRWHGAKSTLTSVMMHLEVGERAVRFAGNWKECRETMSDTYLQSQLLVLSAQEKALHFLRNGGDVGGLEGVPLDFGQSPELEDKEKVFEKKVPEPPEDWRADGLGVQEVCREVLEEALSNGPLTDECLNSEKAMVVELDGFKEILDGAPREEPAETEMVAPEKDRSSDVESSGDGSTCMLSGRVMSPWKRRREPPGVGSPSNPIRQCSW